MYMHTRDTEKTTLYDSLLLQYIYTAGGGQGEMVLADLYLLYSGLLPILATFVVSFKVTKFSTHESTLIMCACMSAMGQPRILLLKAT